MESGGQLVKLVIVLFGQVRHIIETNQIFLIPLTIGQ